MSRTYTARYVFPVSGPPLANGTVTVNGDRIEAVLPHGERTPDEDFGNAAIIPGLVNPHTHLDLSGARGLIPPTDPDRFTDWLRGVIAYRRTRTPEQTQADIRDGLTECLRHGTTLIGDIASEGASWDALAAAEVRAVVFREVIGVTTAGAERWAEGVRWAMDRSRARIRAAYSPHAPYSVNADVLVKSVGCGRPVAIHLAESPAEVELLDRRTGPFVAFLQQLGLWDGAVLPSSLGGIVPDTANAGVPIREPYPVLYVHGNYLSPNTELKAHQSIAYCPRTHAAFGHPAHPFREFLARGIRVCLGTDSLASNPDLDILSEARFVRSRYPDFPGDQLLRMVTLSGAEALGWADETGSLEAGKSADFVVVPLPNADATDPHELLLADHAGAWSGREASEAGDRPRDPARRTMFRGQWRTSASTP